MGTKNGTQWILLSADGQLQGPLSTQEILTRISHGQLLGEERIKPYPDGSWIKVSQNDVFYNEVLRVLEDGPLVATPPEQEVTQPSPTTSNPQAHEPTIIQEVPTKTVPQKVQKTKRPQKPVSKFPPQVFALAGGAVVLAVLGLLFLSPRASESSARLILPNLNLAETWSESQQKQTLQETAQLFLQENHELQLKAQDRLVSLLEGASRNLEGRSLLCLVYKEIWPFTRQTSQDLEAVQVLLQTTRTLDPAGLAGITCQVAQLMVLGKTKEARGFVDYALNQPQFSTVAHLFLLKAELLAAEKDFRSAMLYAEKAAQLLPTWTKAHLLTGMYATTTGQTAVAVREFDQALKLSPQNRKVLLQQSVLFFEKLNAPEKAYEALNLALQSQQVLLRSDQAKMYFLMAQVAQQLSYVKVALEMAEKAYQIQPSNMRIKDFILKLGGHLDLNRALEANNELVFLGDQYARAGDCLSAQAEFKAAFEVDPSNGLAALKAGKCLWQLSLSSEAISWIHKALQADPKLAMAYYVLADYQTQRYQFAAAAQLLQRGSQQVPQHYEILRGFGLIEFRRNNHKEAISYYTRALKIYPNDIDTLVLMAKALLASKDFHNASAYALKAIELDGSSPIGHVVYAQILSATKGADAGVFYLQELIQKYAFTIDFRLALAELNRDVDRHRQAQQIFEQILVVEPKNKRALLGLSDSLKAQGQTDKALKAALDAAIVDPSDSEPLMRAGLIYTDVAKYKEAIVQFQRALRINPLHPRGSYYIGKAAFLAHDLSLALAASNEEKKLNPNLPDSYILAAEVYTAQRDYNKCTQEYQQAIRLQPQGADNYIKIARCYRLAGSPDIAESMLSLAIKEESGRAEIYREQGAVFEQKGERRAAVEAYNKYITLSPNAPDKREIEYKITELGGTIVQ